jgi:cysteine desulfurase
MLPFLTGRFGNPSGSHPVAVDARHGLDDARDVVAAVLGCDAGEVVFTAGGTEADNLAVLGVHERLGGVAVCPAGEHHAVLHCVEAVGGRVVAVDATGAVDLDALAAVLDPSVTVVSVMAVNNEVGTVQPIAEVAALVRERAPEAVLHTDAVQAAPWVDLAELTAHVDLLSISGHKVGGPKGTGLLFVRAGTPLRPRVIGGGQERDRRSGTQDVAGAVALAEACAWLRWSGSPWQHGWAPCGIVWSTDCCRRWTACTRPCPAPEGGRVGARLHRGPRERVAAVPPRP